MGLVVVMNVFGFVWFFNNFKMVIYGLNVVLNFWYVMFVFFYNSNLGCFLILDRVLMMLF